MAGKKILSVDRGEDEGVLRDVHLKAESSSELGVPAQENMGGPPWVEGRKGVRNKGKKNLLREGRYGEPVLIHRWRGLERGLGLLWEGISPNKLKVQGGGLLVRKGVLNLPVHTPVRARVGGGGRKVLKNGTAMDLGIKL